MNKYSTQDRSDDPRLDPVQSKPLEVQVVDGNLEGAIRALRLMVQKERIIANYKDKKRYEKPSDKKRRKQNESIRKRFEAEMRQKKIDSGEYDREKAKKLAKKEEKKKTKENPT